jgi:CHASE3 domain sensor protein
MKNLSIVLKIWLVLGLAVISFTTVVAVSVFFTARNNMTTQEMGDFMYETSKTGLSGQNRVSRRR